MKLKELERYSDELIRSGISGEDYMIKIPVKIFGLLYKTPNTFEDKIKSKMAFLQAQADMYKQKVDNYVMTKEELKSEHGSYTLGVYQELEVHFRSQVNLLEWVLKEC